MTECTELRFAFATEGRREIVAEFNGGAISSDGGAVLLREADRKLKLIERFSQCFLDGRNPALVEHRIEQLLTQRIYGLALGYEDLKTTSSYGTIRCWERWLAKPSLGKSHWRARAR